MTSFLWGMVAGALGMLVFKAIDKAMWENNLGDPVEDGKMSQLKNQNDAYRVKIEELAALNAQLLANNQYCIKNHGTADIKWVEGVNND